MADYMHDIERYLDAFGHGSWVGRPLAIDALRALTDLVYEEGRQDGLRTCHEIWLKANAK